MNREDVVLQPIFDMAAEYFTHLAVACAHPVISHGNLTTDFFIVLNPGRAKSGVGTPDSVSEIMSMETDELLAVANQAGFGARKQEALKRLVRPNIIRPISLTISRHRLSSAMVHDV